MDKLWQFLKSKNALPVSTGRDPAERHEMESDLENNLAKLARVGLLVD